MAHRYRTYPNEHQAQTLASHCSQARFIWNLALEQLNHYDRRIPLRKSPGATERGRQLTELRQATWLGEGSSSIQQQVLRDFDRALKNWWGGSHRRPTWRKVGRNESFCVRDVTIRKINRRWAQVLVPKCGYVRFRLSRPLPAEFGMARVTLDAAGRWHVSFSAAQPVIERQATAAAIGIDLGISSSVTTDAGEQFCAPALKANERKRKLRLERKLARQTKGSNRRNLTKHRIAKLQVRQSDRLKDWREKLTTDLVRKYDMIVIEDLKVRNMMRSASGTLANPGKNVAAKCGLNREIARQGWSALALRLEQKAAASGVQVVKISPKNTSRKCHACDHTAAENRESQAEFCCTKCGHTENADVNAAKNILAAGLAVIGRGGIVRPIAASAASGGPVEASTTFVAQAA